MTRLHRADCTRPGLRRMRAGRGFRYVDHRGRPVTDPATLDRIRALVLPPAWTDVWICPDPLGHIQATGVDAAGRTQYRYHDAWRESRDRQKFEHMLEFARALPRLRRRVERDLAGDGLTRERVLACAVRLLDLGFFRVGSETYAERNGSYGLATIRTEHVRLSGDEITFDYAAKSGQRRVQSVVDAPVADVLRALKRRRSGGPELLAYRTPAGDWSDVKSADINAYVKEATGGEYTAKDFRTWNATLLCAVSLASTPATGERAVRDAMCETAHYLGNTPAVCRSSYVDPRVVERFAEGRTVRRALTTGGNVERAVVTLVSRSSGGGRP